MAGVTDYAFRVIAKEFGAAIVYSEFVSAHGIIRKNEKTLKMIQFSDFERPIGIQIFGDTPEVMQDAARVVYEKSSDLRMNHFISFLENKGVVIKVRRSRGKDIDAACGQLANKKRLKNVKSL